MKAGFFVNAAARIAIRWTIGNVSAEGFQALRFSILGTWKIFGPSALYAVCVNSVEISRARELTGEVPTAIQWLRISRNDIPPFLRDHLDGGMSEGVGWKFAPVRLFPECHELSLDNDCILWSAPDGLERWLENPGGRLIAEDVCRCFGKFSERCGNEPRNSGIRGLPPGLDFERVLKTELRENPVTLQSELDEQGLQVAALGREGNPHVVSATEVSICSPFPPHAPGPGKCGVHFVGLNARQLPWSLNNRPASEFIRENWTRWKKVVENNVRIE
jgi:hypothetical protein